MAVITNITIPYTDSIIPEKFFHDALSDAGYPDAVTHTMLSADIMIVTTVDSQNVVIVASARGDGNVEKYIRFEIIDSLRKGA